MHKTLQALQQSKNLSLNEMDLTPDTFARYAYRGQLEWKNAKLIGLNLCDTQLTDTEWQSFVNSSDISFEHIRSLNLSENQLTNVDLPELPALEYLNISENPNLENLAFNKALPHLKRLDARICKIKSLYLPYGFTELQSIDLCHNKALTKIQIEGDCPKLKQLDLSNNQLKQVELNGPYLELQYLYLNDNKIRDLKFSSDLPALETLHLRNNQLQTLPEEVIKRKDHLTLYLHGNPLETINREFIHKDERGNSFEKIRDLFRAGDIKGTLINNRVKIIIVGNGRVGKTSMLKRLKGEDFDADEGITHGIELGLLDKSHLPKVETPTLNASVWDFGGQEIFYATHQFFLSEDALYLLAWTKEQNVTAHREKSKETYAFPDKWRKPTYWLNSIRLRAKKSPILMVYTHADKERLDPPQICKQAPYHATPINFSASEDIGLLELKEQITRKLNKEGSLLGKEFPVVFEQGIKLLEEQKDKKIISRPEFNELCVSVGIEENLTDTFLSYLHSAGQVVHINNPASQNSGLSNQIYVDPDWLTQEVYKLINHDLKDREGRFNRSYLKIVLPEYTEGQHTVFLDLLKEFELIFQESEETFIAPQYLPSKPQKREATYYGMALKRLKRAFVFRFPLFVPDNIMINFLSRYGPLSEEKVYYKHGIYFMGENQAECVVEFHESARTLSVFTAKNEESRILEQKVMANFVELSKNANADISLNGRDFVSWQELQKALERNAAKIPVLKEDGEEEGKERLLEISAFTFYLGEGDKFPHGEMRLKGIQLEHIVDLADPMEWTDAHDKLQERLEQLFNKVNELRRICRTSNLKRVNAINLETSIDLAWFNVIEHAMNYGQLPQLIKRTLIISEGDPVLTELAPLFT